MKPLARFSIAFLILFGIGCGSTSSSNDASSTGGSGGASATGGSTGAGGAVGGHAGGATGGGGAAGSSGTAGRGAGGANGGASGTGSVCPGVQPLSGQQCRTASDCPSGRVCVSSTLRCCNMPSTACEAACTATSCGSTERCNAAGHCETFPCAAGFKCPAATVCSTGATGADANGCAPQPCTAGYACADGFQCAAGTAGADAHGCAPQPCSQTGCPINFVCQPTATSGGCTTKTCSVDGDCDCGFCIQGYCANRLNACALTPA